MIRDNKVVDRVSDDGYCQTFAFVLVESASVSEIAFELAFAFLFDIAFGRLFEHSTRDYKVSYMMCY